MGFIFRKVHKPETEDECLKPIPNGVGQSLLVNGGHEPETIMVNGLGENLEDEGTLSQDSTEQNLSLDASLLVGEELEEGCYLSTR